MHIEVSAIRGTLLWAPYNKDPTIGTFLGSPIFGKSHIKEFRPKAQNPQPPILNKDPTIGTILGSPIFGKSHIKSWAGGFHNAWGFRVYWSRVLGFRV